MALKTDVLLPLHPCSEPNAWNLGSLTMTPAFSQADGFPAVLQLGQVRTRCAVRKKQVGAEAAAGGFRLLSLLGFMNPSCFCTQLQHNDFLTPPTLHPHQHLHVEK
ncbi:uncharacterized [Tachysurus ichikawai]